MAKAVDKYRSVITASKPDAPEADAFFDAVGAGNSDALLAFPMLRPHLDAGFAESADISLSMALAKNPMGVLALLNSPGKLKTACVSNFIEPEPGVERAWYRNAEKALSKIDAKSPLAARRDACLEIMRSDEQNSGASAPVTGQFRQEPAQVADRPIHFEDYKVPVSTVHYPARLQVTDAKSREFVTMLRESAGKSPNFAGHFVLASWGCGASCIMIAAIDRRSGQVFWLPFTLCCWKADIAEPLEFRTGSSLLVLHGSRNESGGGTYYYNFSHHSFRLIRAYEADKP
jgi:hypothetical protein